jgi:Zn-dependent protease
MEWPASPPMNLQLENGLVWFGVFLFSTTCHEASHAWTALKLGDSTAAAGGQVTLNPLPHIKREFVGMVVVPLLSLLALGWVIGWASAPFNPEWARNFPRRAALMALAGPAANLLLAVAAVGLIRIGYEWEFFAAPQRVSAAHLAIGFNPGLADLVGKVLSVFVSLNLLLFGFNLLPLPPLDGSYAPFLLMNRNAADSYRQLIHSPWLAYVGVLVASKLVAPVLPALVTFVANVIYPSMHYA